MCKTFCFMAIVAVAGAAGCQSHPHHHCQHSSEPAGTAHIQCDAKSGTCASIPGSPSPSAPIPPPQDIDEETATKETDTEEPVVEETVVETSKPKTVPIRVAALPQPVTPRTGVIYGCDKKYTWLVGKLRRVHVPGGEWKVRFLELDKIDRWGGSMVLAPDIRLDDFSDGDCVYIEGEILVERPSLYLAGPLYRVHTIRTVTLADRRRAALANP